MPKPKMTAQEATTFQSPSLSNEAIVNAARSQRAESGLYPQCKCQPYQDTFTYARWKAQGFQVRKGEKALAKVVVVREWTGQDKDGKEIVKQYPSGASVFCRCQVDECGAEPAAAPLSDSLSVDPLGVSDERFAALEF